MELEKISNGSNKTIRRRFDDACGLAHGLELVGDRWALFVMREMMLGPRRFSGLRADIPGLSANVLSQRLAELEARGIVERATLPPPANVQVYGLTPWGYEAEPILQEIGRWAVRSPLHDPTLPISAVSVMLSLRTMIVPGRVGAHDFRVGFRFGRMAFCGHVAKGAIAVAREEPHDAALVFSGTPPGLAALVHGKIPLPALAADGLLRGAGDAALLALFPTLFELPPKINLPAGPE